MLVYIVCSYQEDGPEEIAATTDKAKVCGIVAARYDSYLEAAPLGPRRDMVVADRAEALSSLDAMLATDPDAGFSRDLLRGWGGLQLHVVELT